MIPAELNILQELSDEGTRWNKMANEKMEEMKEQDEGTKWKMKTIGVTMYR